MDTDICPLCGIRLDRGECLATDCNYTERGSLSHLFETLRNRVDESERQLRTDKAVLHNVMHLHAKELKKDSEQVYVPEDKRKELEKLNDLYDAVWNAGNAVKHLAPPDVQAIYPWVSENNVLTAIQDARRELKRDLKDEQDVDDTEVISFAEGDPLGD